MGSFEGLSKKVDMSPLAIVLNVLETKKRNLLNRLSYSVLITSFSVSIAILIFKMIVSKKIWRVAGNFLIGSSFALILLVSGGSLVAIMLKPN